MKTVYETTANYSRRKYRMRCKCCGKSIAEGDPAIVLPRTSTRTGVSWALHAECGALRHSESYTWREVFHAWAKGR